MAVVCFARLRAIAAWSSQVSSILSNRYRSGFQFHLAGFDFRKIEYVVYEYEEVFGASLRGFEELLFLVGRLVL